MKTNKQIKRVIASVTGGEWVNDASYRMDSPSLWFFDCGFTSKLLKEYERYHSTVSIKENEVK